MSRSMNRVRCLGRVALAGLCGVVPVVNVSSAQALQESAAGTEKAADESAKPEASEGEAPAAAEAPEATGAAPKPVEPPKASTASEADAKQRCAVAYESAQEARAAGELKRAQENLVVCAQSNCAAFIQADCSDWLTAVQRDLPSVVFSAKKPNGEESFETSVMLDGDLIATSLDGRAVPIDPGVHEFEFALDGFKSVRRRVVIRQGEKNRVVGVVFGPTSAPGESDFEEQVQDTGPGYRLRPWAYASWGVGAGALVGAFFLNRSARSQEDDFLARCDSDGDGTLDSVDPDVTNPPAGCEETDLDRVQGQVDNKLLWTTVTFGVGILGVAGGTVLYFLKDPSADEQAGLQVDVSPRVGGGFASVSGTF